MPTCPRVGVLALVPDRFGGTWQLRHQLLTRLARVFSVVWVDPPVPWRGARPAPADYPDPSDAGEMQVLRSGRLLPQLYRPHVLVDAVERARLRRAVALLRRSGADRLVLYLWRPVFADALDRIPHDLSCYHIDDEYSFSVEEQPIDPAERRLIERVDQVFIHSRSLFEKKGGINPNTRIVSNGVDFAAYTKDHVEPPDLRAIPHPRVGYTGMLKPQLDWELLGELARKHSEWSFVLLGPRGYLQEQAKLLDALAALPNVFELGGRSVESLPAYVQHFDVGLLPYRVNDYTRYIYPLKLHEYLAAGIPTVGAAIPTLQEFSDAVAIADSREAWSEALVAALEPGEASPERRASRQAVARPYDWNIKVPQVAEAIAEGLDIELPPLPDPGETR